MSEEKVHKQEQSDIEQLEDIMALLPDVDKVYPTGERRKFSLTKDDVLIIFKIAKVAGNHKCPFEEGEAETLQTVASNINRTQKIAATIMITGIVTAILSGIWLGFKHVVLEWLNHGGKLG